METAHGSNPQLPAFLHLFGFPVDGGLILDWKGASNIWFSNLGRDSMTPIRHDSLQERSEGIQVYQFRSVNNSHS